MSAPLRLIPSSSSLVRGFQEELSSRLPEVERQLLALLGFSDFLTCLTVARHERAVGRMILPHAKLEPAMEGLRRLGVSCLRSQVDFMHKANLVEATNHEGAFVPRGTAGTAHGVLYFGVSEELVAGAEVVDLQGEHAMLARLFGYPECCIQFFSQQQVRRFDRTPDSIPDTGPFSREMNPFLSYLYGLGLLFHFPCSPRCEASHAQFRQRRDYLEQFAPQSARALASVGAGIALYGPRIGTALVTGYRHVDGNTYEVQEVVTRGKHAEALFGTSSGPLRLTLHSAHDFEVGTARFADEHHAAARFE